MKRMKRTGLIILTVLAMILPMFNVSAAVIEEQAEVVFYQNGNVVEQNQIEADTPVTAKVRVVSEVKDKNQSFYLILAAYTGDKSELADVNFEKKEIYNVPSGIEAPTAQYFETGEVTMPSGGSVAVYIWKGSNIVPEGKGTGIVNQGVYCLSGIKIGSYTTAVDQIGKRILVKTTDDIASVAVSDVKVPSDCTYQVTAGNKALVLTTPTGTVEYRIVKTDAFDYYDFNNEALGALPKNGTGKWFNHNSAADTSVEYAADILDAGNKVIKVTDNNTSGSATARLSLSTEKAYPYVVSYKIMYDQPNSTDNISYCRMHLYNNAAGGWKSIANGTAAKLESGEFVFAKENDNNSFVESSREYFDLKTWHEVSLAVVDAKTIEYYFDGKFIGKSENTVDKTLNSIRLTTHAGNTCTAYLDDVMIRDYYVEKADLYSASFKDSSDNTVAGYMYDGKVYANAASLDGLTLGAYSVSDGANAVLDNANAKITVTSADGKTQNYDVVAKTFFTDDFESYDENAVLQTVNPTWYKTTTNVTGRTALVTADGSNKMLRLTSNSNRGGFVYTQINIPENTNSFVAEYRVRYGLVDGTTFGSDTSPNYSYVGRYKDSSTMAYGLQPIGGSATSNMNLQGTAKKNITKNSAIAMNKWYTMKMVYKKTGDTASVTYYLDGELLGTQDMEAEVVDTDYLEIRTGNRTCITDYDDITILPLD